MANIFGLNPDAPLIFEGSTDTKLPFASFCSKSPTNTLRLSPVSACIAFSFTKNGVSSIPWSALETFAKTESTTGAA